MNRGLFNKVTTWQRNTFPQATPLSKLAHLEQELRELKDDLQSQNPARVLEYADCFMLLFGAAASDGMEYDDICKAINDKMAINLNRKWGKPDANGVVNHIKEGPCDHATAIKFDMQSCPECGYIFKHL